jgi:hypothetical protein
LRCRSDPLDALLGLPLADAGLRRARCRHRPCSGCPVHIVRVSYVKDRSESVSRSELPGRLPDRRQRTPPRLRTEGFEGRSITLQTGLPYRGLSESRSARELEFQSAVVFTIADRAPGSQAARYGVRVIFRATA